MPGNEHGVRVNVSVVRRPQVTSENELLVRRLVLPLLLIGLLPTTEQAQQASALIRTATPEARADLMTQVVGAWIDASHRTVSRSRP